MTDPSQKVLTIFKPFCSKDVCQKSEVTVAHSSLLAKDELT